jgi:hypothetical protein
LTVFNSRAQATAYLLALTVDRWTLYEQSYKPFIAQVDKIRTTAAKGRMRQWERQMCYKAAFGIRPLGRGSKIYEQRPAGTQK